MCISTYYSPTPYILLPLIYYGVLLHSPSLIITYLHILGDIGKTYKFQKKPINSRRLHRPTYPPQPGNGFPTLEQDPSQVMDMIILLLLKILLPLKHLLLPIRRGLGKGGVEFGTGRGQWYFTHSNQNH